MKHRIESVGSNLCPNDRKVNVTYTLHISMRTLLTPSKTYFSKLSIVVVTESINQLMKKTCPSSPLCNNALLAGIHVLFAIAIQSGLQTASLDIPILAPNKSACTVEHCILAISVIGILNRISSAFVSLDSTRLEVSFSSRIDCLPNSFVAMDLYYIIRSTESILIHYATIWEDSRSWSMSLHPVGNSLPHKGPFREL